MNIARAELASEVATVAGLVTVVVIVLIALAARRPSSRPAPAAAPTERTRSTAGRRAVILVVVGTGLAGSVAIAGPLALVVAGAAALATVVKRRRRLTVGRQRAIEAAMPDVVELLVLCVHAGRSPTQAVVELARRAPLPLRPGFAAVERQLHRGRGLADALAELPRALGPPARELATSIAIADREGLPLAPVLDRLAAEARAGRRRMGEAAARRLPVRLSFPLVVCTLPSFVLLAIAPAVLGAISTLRGTVP
jgi:tight adherence protein C